MATPIQPSPTLDEEMLEDFLKEMNKPPSKKKIEHFKRIEREFDRSHFHLITDSDYEFPPILRKNGKIE